MNPGFQEKEYTKRFDLPVWKKILRYSTEYKRTFIYLIFVMLAVGFIDVIFPLVTKFAIDNYIMKNTYDGIWVFVLVLFFIIMLQGVNVWLLITLGGRIEAGVTRNLRKAVFEHLQKLSFSFYDKTPAGWIMARMLSDIKHVSTLISWGIIDTTWGISLMTAIIIILFVLNAKLAAITIIVVPFLVVISLFFQKRILGWQRKIKKTNSSITASFNEGLMGAKTSKTLVIEDDNIKDFEAVTKEMYGFSMKAAITSAAYFPIVSLFSMVGTALVIYFGGNDVLDNVISFGTLVAFVNYTGIFFMPVMDFARTFANMQQAQAGAERIMGLIDTLPDVKDPPEIENMFGSVLSNEVKHDIRIQGNIEFKNVDFYYTQKEKILIDFNLKVDAGEKIALVGETGSGKSTIVNLICRFYEPVSGQILIDGVDYRERSLSWLHSNIGYVLQSPHLFSGTIAENISYGRKDASFDDIVTAAKLVNAHNFITRLKEGYDTKTGEGGSLLSTGEKQLISFARAVLTDPALFILDEATSSIDTETEKIIQDAISNVLKNRTSFIIAHRLSTVRNCDRIILIEDGRIIEMGNHHELIKRKGRYYKLYTNQYIDEQELGLLTKV